MINSFKSIKKINLFIFAILFIGIVLFVNYIFEYKKASYEVSSNIRLLGYVSVLIILSGLYTLAVRSKRVIISNFILVFLLVLLVEIFCFFKLNKPIAVKKDFSPIDLPEDHIAKHIGVVPYADSVYHNLVIKDKDTVLNFIATIDKESKRSTPNHSKDRLKHALFFGCSITFGEGVQDNETMSYYFQEISQEYNSYNFGLSGHATNHMLARLQFKPLKSQVTEENGVAFYIFFWDHIYRSIGSMNRYCDWLHNAPYYYLKNDKLYRNKMFCDGRRKISWIYENLYQTNIVKNFKIDFPIKINKTHLNLVAEMIKESKLEYQRQYPNNEFYCVLYPEWAKEKDGLNEDLKIVLKEKGIKFIDLTWFEYKKEHTLGLDPHPNPKTHHKIASIIFEKLKSKN